MISRADGGTITDGVTVRTETGSKLSTELLESVCVVRRTVCVLM